MKKEGKSYFILVLALSTLLMIEFCTDTLGMVDVEGCLHKHPAGAGKQ
jgi:hypothetical protein